MTKYKKDIFIKNAALATWIDLNAHLRKADEKICRMLLKEEKAGRNRHQFVVRIYSRLNRVRAQRERRELTK